MKKYLIAVFVCFAFLLYIPMITQASPLAFETERIAGQDRIETALSISQKGWSSSAIDAVILCEQSDYPDSIAAAPFAVNLDAPVLLTGGNSIDPRVVEELRRLEPERVILLGGTGCLTPAIETELESMSLDWERIGGKDRYETSVLLASELNSDSLIIANGDDFPDALSAASYAGMQQIPIVLTSQTLPPSVAAYCEQNQPQHVIVIGGEAVVPGESLTKLNINIETRLGGQDRFETNAKVLTYMKDAVDSDNLFLASGINFPDAVAGTVLAAKEKASLVLSAQKDIPPSVYKFMREHMKVEPSVTTTKSGRGRITASGGLNLRDTPAIAGKLLLTIPEGSMIDIIEAQDQWYKTVYQGQRGWLSADYVTIVETYKQAEITANGGLNLRQSPATTGKLMITIPETAKVTIIEEQGDWYKVNYRGKVGWVYAEYVRTISGENGSSDNSAADLSPNGKVYILGGSGVISENAEGIIKGKRTSAYAENLQEFPTLPSSLEGSTQEVLVDPFQDIATNSLNGKKILIDPGHGGPDSGAIGWNYSYEKDNNLAISLFLKDILAEAGAEVSMTRNTDVSVASSYSEREDLQARVDIANNIKPDLFISIHNNANYNPDKKGTSVFYSDVNPKQTESRRLARAILNTMTNTVQTLDEGVREADFFVLKNTAMPAVLVEAAYISNPEEEVRLENPIFQKNTATAIFHGVLEYYGL